MNILNKSGKIIHSIDSDTLRGADLWGANLRHANLWGANLRGADLRDADLWDADLRHADLWGANLRHANLRHANLWGANLRGADLRDADLRDADLRDADLGDADLGDAKSPPIQISALCWPILIHDGNIRIGCEIHTLSEWETFTDEEISAMDSHALKFWKQYGPGILLLAQSHN